MRGKENLTSNEKFAVKTCVQIQELCKTLGKNLNGDIRENAMHLVALYKLQGIMSDLREMLPKTPVFHDVTGKHLGDLYDNEYIEGVMISTNIDVNSAVQHTEWHIRMNARKYIL